MAFVDRTLQCVECGQDFVFTAGDQEFHASKGFTNEPKRCRNCRIARRDRVGTGGATMSSYAGSSAGYGSRPAREMYPAICAQCGVETQVPFQPRGDRPVYCNDCFHKTSGSYASRQY